MRLDKNKLLLYAVTDRHWLNGAALCEQVEKAIEGGVTFVQLREKELDLNPNKENLIQEAAAIRDLCKRQHIPFVINDYVELAKMIDADGVHVGQSDMETGDVRAAIGNQKILGVSVQTVKQAVLAQKRGADYLGVGAVFPTGSKSDAEDVDYKTLQEICHAVSIPVIAIGGICSENVMQLSRSGICGVAVISGIFAKKDIVRATEELKNRVEKMVGKVENSVNNSRE